MATDWLVYWMVGPLGLFIIAATLALSVFIWSAVLGNAYPRIGYWPVFVGYACGTPGFLINNFWYSYNEFSNRVSAGLLEESQRWSIVPGWAVYVSVLCLICALPIATLVYVPLSAGLLREGMLTLTSIVTAVILIWLGLAVIAWALLVGSFDEILADLLPVIALTMGPFLLGIYATSRSVAPKD